MFRMSVARGNIMPVCLLAMQINTSKQRAGRRSFHQTEGLLDLFDNPVGYLTSPAVFQAKAGL
jgi:hypothetical protein